MKAWLKSSMESFASPLVTGLLVVSMAAIWAPGFLYFSTQLAILDAAAAILPATLGMQALMIAGRFDLSVGSVAALSGVVFGVTLANTNSFACAILGCIICSLMLGGFMGIAASALRLDPLIVTVAMAAIARSSALVLSNGRTIGEFPLYVASYMHGESANRLLLVAAILLAVSVAQFQFHVPSRNLFAIGSNLRVASAVGLPVTALTVFAYCLCALGATTTGILQSLRSMSASPLVFQDLALDVIAACVIGGGSLRGGKGSMVGALLGLLVVVATRNLVVAMGLSIYWRYFFIGSLLLTAAIVNRLVRSDSLTKQMEFEQ